MHFEEVQAPRARQRSIASVMASALNRFGALAVRHSFRTRPQSLLRSSSQPAYFHSSPLCRDDKPSPPKDASTETEKSPAPQSIQISENEDGDEIVNYGEIAEDRDPFWGFRNSMSMSEREKIKKEMTEMLENPSGEHADRIKKWKKEVAALESQFLREWETFNPPENDYLQPKPKQGLLSMGETHPDLMMEDPEDEGDDITSTAHGELEQHREIREYTRIAAWEMPLLSQYAKKFEPPPKERPLRFRHTTYMGETHPAQNKIVLEFCTADLPLTNTQRLKLIKLVGVRYDPRKDLVKISCEMFETPAQNKRYLGDLVDTLMKEAKNESSAEGGKDKFEDIQPDFRHVKWKKRLAFPSAWKITPERQTALEAERKQRYLAEIARRETGGLINGASIVDKAIYRQSRSAQVTLEKQRAGVRVTR